MPLDLLLSPAPAFEDSCAAVLDYLHETVPLGYWSISRYDGERQLYLQVRDDAYGTRDGDSHSWDASLCRSMVSGSPRIAPDAMAVPEYAAADITRQMRIGTYVGMPIRSADGELFGTLCGLDPDVRDTALLEHRSLLELLSTLLTTILQSERARSDVQRLARRAAREAETDPLTGAGNRRAWQRFLDEEEDVHRAFGDLLTLVVVDLDGLKDVNDEQGHAAGDRLIQETARVLRRHVREQDLVARLGGDEFGLALTRITPSQVAGVVERLRAALAESGIAASIGCSPHRHTDSLTATWERADAGMYRDKRRRRGSAAPPAEAAGARRDEGAQPARCSEERRAGSASSTALGPTTSMPPRASTGP